MKIQVYDGHKIIGGNKIFITDSSNKTLLLDFGRNYPMYNKYFEEFLTPRPSAGICDFWKLGIIPKFSGLYRDGLTYNIRHEEASSPRIEPIGIFLSHAHMDHIGDIPFLREDIPIITSRESFYIMKAIQDTGQQGLLYEYYTASTPKIENGAKVEKIRKDKDMPTQMRSFVFPIEGELNKIGNFKYRLFSVDHSVPGSEAIYIEVDGVKIAYTGDIRLHGERRADTLKFFEFLKNNQVDVLIIEGTKAAKNRTINELMSSKEPTKEDVKNASYDVVSKNKGKIVIADFGARNIERLKIFLEIAKDTNRKLAVTTKDAYLLHLLKDAGLKSINDDNLVIVESKREPNRNWLKEVVNNYQNKFVTINEIEKNSGEYILCYSLWDMPNLLDSDIRDGAYIYSTSEAHTEEQYLDTVKLLNWIKYFNLKPYGLEERSGEIVFTREFHGSGHASFKELISLISYANPKSVFPVHTENQSLFIEYFKDSNIKVIKESEFKEQKQYINKGLNLIL